METFLAMHIFFIESHFFLFLYSLNLTDIFTFFGKPSEYRADGTSLCIWMLGHSFERSGVYIDFSPVSLKMEYVFE